MSASIRKRRPLDIWPAFVDATASLLMVVVFVLLIASLGQLFLTTELAGRDSALTKLNAQLASLTDELSMETSRNRELDELIEIRNASLEAAKRAINLGEMKIAAQALEIEVSDAKIEQQEAAFLQQAQALVALESEVAALSSLRDRLREELDNTLADRKDIRERLAQESALNVTRVAQLEHLNRQLSEVRTQLTSLSEALELAQTKRAADAATIDDLGRRLNIALATKAQELQRYRSAFFGRLREALADYPGIEIVGDRFVLPSGLLFGSGSDELDASGQRQIEKLAATLHDLSQRIPDDIDWVLRIDGHTDARAINTERFPSNWELSAARAIRIARTLARFGIPEHRLAATGFAEHHPIDRCGNPCSLCAQPAH